MGDVKADQKASVHPNEAIKEQLQQEGLQQAAEFSKQQLGTVTLNSTQLNIGLRVFSSNLSQNVVIDGEKIKDSQQSGGQQSGDENESTSLFDFEKVARNVLGFVSSVIRGAAEGGADDEKLNSLFSQAREGVSKGFAMAEKDLAGFMNEELEEGISNSRTLIDNGIDDLENDIFNRNNMFAVGEINALSASDAKSGNILIRTKDGDEVTLSFESAKKLSMASSSVTYDSTNDSADSNEGTNVSSSLSLYYESYERSGIHFSLKGEIDEDEMNAIAELVGKVQDLADTFYSGDLDHAFEQALNLGFDEKELVGYALQLNRTTQTEVVKTYENIQHYSEQGDAENQYGNVVSPIAQYLEKMISTFNDSKNLLESGDDYNNLVTGIINEMEDVQVPDLISAINRFHLFNKTLLDSMPQEVTNVEG